MNKQTLARDKAELAFEVWANNNGFDLSELFFSQSPNRYVDPATNLAFDIWMASWSVSKQEQKVKDAEIVETFPDSCCDECNKQIAKKIRES